MGPTRSKIKKTRKSIMKSTQGESRHYTYAAVLGICIACLPFLVAASQHSDGLVGASASRVDLDGDLEASESQNIGVAQRAQPKATPIAVPTSPVPVAVPPPSPSSSVAAPPAGFVIPKSDLSSAPSYAPRYVVPPHDPWGERLPFEVQQFRRRATDDEGRTPDDDYQPQESKGKKHSPGVLKRVRNSIRNTGKAIVGAPSYILKRYRGTWKKYFGGGGGKKKKGGWKGWSNSPSEGDKGWGGWEETEPAGGYGYDEPSHFPADKGWKSDSGWSKGYDSHERRDRDRESTGYRDYRDSDSNRDYNRPSSRPSRYRPERGERPKQNSSYREETHYDDYDGRRTTAYYGPSSRKNSSKRPSKGSSSSSYKYDDDY